MIQTNVDLIYVLRRWRCHEVTEVDGFKKLPPRPYQGGAGGGGFDLCPPLAEVSRSDGGGFNVNASLYDIREHFQGRNPAGKMNNKSDDAHYMELITALRDKLKLLAKKIEPKVYEYGFLKS